jgi:hypothetical protein
MRSVGHAEINLVLEIAKIILLTAYTSMLYSKFINNNVRTFKGKLALVGKFAQGVWISA